ncbi:MAG: hypothetical protein B7Y45_12460 [Sphingomonas sp. 28-66-16]|nr:MAG: hypothetical protein B7Y45_12460 [Sphingomonas sp. 28-66-16]
MMSGDRKAPGSGTSDDGYDEDGYDESQRAEILEATQTGHGTIITDLVTDLGGEEPDEGMDDEEDGDRIVDTDDG